MINLKSTALGLSILALSGAAALAQPTSNMSQSAAAKPMSAADTAMMTKCKAMSHEMMMKDKDCTATMKAHGDMAGHMGGQEAGKSGAMSGGATSGGTMSGGTMSGGSMSGGATSGGGASGGSTAGRAGAGSSTTPSTTN